MPDVQLTGATTCFRRILPVGGDRAVLGNVVGVLKRVFRPAAEGLYYDSAKAYSRFLASKLKEHANDRALAFAEAIGSASVAMFEEQGNGQVAVLRHHGLQDGMALYDLGCGCGRTAQALRRSGWQGRYTGADIVAGFIDEVRRTCPDYTAHVHLRPSLVAEDASIDMVYHWSVFTHVSPEECFLYLRDTFRALKPGAVTVFSFLEIGHAPHQTVFDKRVERYGAGKRQTLLDTFLHPDWLRFWAERIGFEPPIFTSGQDDTSHPPFWQSLVAMRKPA